MDVTVWNSMDSDWLSAYYSQKCSESDPNSIITCIAVKVYGVNIIIHNNYSNNYCCSNSCRSWCEQAFIAQNSHKSFNFLLFSASVFAYRLLSSNPQRKVSLITHNGSLSDRVFCKSCIVCEHDRVSCQFTFCWFKVRWVNALPQRAGTCPGWSFRMAEKSKMAVLRWPSKA